jgi:hypothetical protein
MIPQMSYAERMARCAAKQTLLRNFLASGEVYTSISIAAQLMACSTSSAERTLKAMVRAGEVNAEVHLVEGRKLAMWGVTPHGLALANQFDHPHFEHGRISSSYIFHHLLTQQARLQAEAAGWAWQPGKLLHNTGLPKVPDALATRPDGRKIGVEIELNVKSQRRFQTAVAQHLLSIKKGHWAEVYYLTHPELKQTLQKAFARLETVPVPGGHAKLEESHKNRFRFYSFTEFPPFL